MRGLIAWGVLAVTALSLLWTTIKSRRILRAALGRDLRKGEETSLRSWMQASDASLHRASEELQRNPFDRFLRLLAAFGIWRGDIGSPTEDRTL
jgi:hypothetical protein